MDDKDVAGCGKCCKGAHKATMVKGGWGGADRGLLGAGGPWEVALPLRPAG